MAQSISEQRESQDAKPHYAHRNDPQNVIDRLKESLPEGTTTVGSFKKGGRVPKTGAYKLEKGERVLTALQGLKQPAQDSAQPPDAQTALASKAAQSDSTQQPAPDDTPQQSAVPAQDDTQDAGSGATLSDEPAAQTVNLCKAYSKLQEALTKLADGSGVRRTVTIPYVDGEPMQSHIQAVSQAIIPAGGLTANLLTSYHHAGGKGWGSGDGSTQAWNAEKLRQTIIPKKSELAKDAVDATRSFISKLEFLLGKDESTIKTAKAQLQIVGSQDLAGMNVADAMAALINLVHQPLQKVAQRHQLAQHGGEAHAKLTTHRELQQQPQQQ